MIYTNFVKLCSGKASGRVLNLELYVHKRQKLTLLHLFKDLFRKESLFRINARLVQTLRLF